MKKLNFIILTFLFIISSCNIDYNTKEKYATLIIKKIEEFKINNDRLPNNLTEIGLNINEKSLVFYKKISKNEFEVWYGIELGESKIYNSELNKWR